MRPKSILNALLALDVLLSFGCSKPAHTSQTTSEYGEARLTANQMKHAGLVIEPLGQHPVGGALVTSGRVAFDDLRVAHVSSPVTGRVVHIDSQLGDRVKKGDILVTLDSPDVSSAASDLAKAHADIIAAENEFKRQKELFEAHAGSQRDYQTAQDNFEKTRAEFQRAQQRARLLRAASATTISQTYQLRAPIDGEVIARNVNPGTEVQGQYSGGTSVELFTIGELNSVWVLADVFEMDLSRVRVNTPALIKVVTYPDKVFRGTVTWVSGVLDPVTRTAKVRCQIDNKDLLLKPEMYATISLLVDQRSGLALPRSAVIRLADQTMVFVEKGRAPDGRVRFERRRVVVDEELGGAFLPVKYGLQEGERVVTAGAVLLSGML